MPYHFGGTCIEIFTYIQFSQHFYIAIDVDTVPWCTWTLGTLLAWYNQLQHWHYLLLYRPNTVWLDDTDVDIVTVFG